MASMGVKQGFAAHHALIALRRAAVGFHDLRSVPFVTRVDFDGAVVRLYQGIETSEGDEAAERALTAGLNEGEGLHVAIPMRHLDTHDVILLLVDYERDRSLPVRHIPLASVNPNERMVAERLWTIPIAGVQTRRVTVPQASVLDPATQCLDTTLAAKLRQEMFPAGTHQMLTDETWKVVERLMTPPLARRPGRRGGCSCGPESVCARCAPTDDTDGNAVVEDNLRG